MNKKAIKTAGGKKNMKKKKDRGIINICNNNPWGVVGLCFSWCIPFLSILLGIIGLNEEEPLKIISLSSIVVNVFFTSYWWIFIGVLI